MMTLSSKMSHRVIKTRRLNLVDFYFGKMPANKRSSKVNPEPHGAIIDSFSRSNISMTEKDTCTNEFEADQMLPHRLTLQTHNNATLLLNEADISTSA